MARAAKPRNRKPDAPKRKPGMSRAATTAEKTQRAIELLIEHGRAYQAASVLMQEYQCTRRTAQNFLVRARTEIAAQYKQTLTDYGPVLLFRLDQVYRDARAAGDYGAAVRALVELAKLVEAASRDETDDQPVRKIIFEVYDPSKTDNATDAA